MKNLFSAIFLLLFFCAELQGVNFHLEKKCIGARNVSFAAEKDFFAELIYYPAAGTKEHVCAGFTADKWKALLRHREDKLELLVNGRLIGSYPFYYGGYLGGERRADSVHILLQKQGETLQAVLEGTLFAAAKVPGSVDIRKTFFTGGKIEELRVSSGSIPGQDMKQRALDRWRNRVPGVKMPSPVAAPPELRVMPVIDGAADEKTAAQATRLSLRSMDPKRYNYSGNEKNFMLIGRKGDHLWIFWQLEKKSPGIPVKLGGRDKGLWNVESAEFFLLPPGSDVPYQFIVSTGGELYDARGSNRNWNADVKYAVKCSSTLWCGEMLINSKSSGLPGFQEKKRWKMDFFATMNWESWAPAGRYHDTSAYGELLFVREVPAVSGDVVTAVVDSRLCISKSLYAPGEVEPVTNSVTRVFRGGKRERCGVAMPGGYGTRVTGISYKGELIFRQGEIFQEGERK